MNNFKILMLALLVTFPLLLTYRTFSAKEILPLTHIHGIAVNPDNPDTIYVGTHIGLLLCDSKECELVGNDRSDYMGFNISTDGKTFTPAAISSRQGRTGD